MPDLPLVPVDYPGEQEWQAWLADETHLYSKRAVLANYPTAARAIFIDGFKAAAEPRDQRIESLEAVVKLTALHLEYAMRIARAARARLAQWPIDRAGEPIPPAT